MGGCGWLATTLDRDMLGAGLGPEWQAERLMKRRDDPAGIEEVARELGGRMFVHYIPDYALQSFAGREDLRWKMWVTPTPYSSEEAIDYLRLPFPHIPRRYVLLIDPRELDGPILGPKLVRQGGGSVEYLLPNGAPLKAVAEGWMVRLR
ncbi:hypothetical protein GCM10009760_18660 [Kitasatospora kazusensis]|uniref:Uncharacterized protein n=1 Tax=Kitasatospora kazusensis TaxID=407974 RepID=A0ABP5L1V5_9ACTN